MTVIVRIMNARRGRGRRAFALLEREARPRGAAVVPRTCGRPGFTLVEALMASVVLAVVAASALLPFAAGTQQVNESAKLDQAITLGQALMEEILARPFFAPGNRTASPGPETGETTKASYTSVDDFNTYAESTSAVKDYQGATVTDQEVQGYRRTATVQYVTVPNQRTDDTNAFIQVRVDVYHNDALLASLTRIVGRED